MTVGNNAAMKRCKIAIKFGISLICNTFNSSKCKTMTKMAVARIKLLRNKRLVVVKQMRRDIALLLQSGQDATARIRVEHVIREQNVLAANEFIELFCELVVARLSIISKQRECPQDLKEGISSLIFAAPRCADIPELLAIRDIFQKKYGKEFVSAATDLRPSCGVNRMLIDKLSVKTPSGEVKLKIMKEIAKEYQVEWDTTESEMELLKPPEELIDGPKTFVSATSLPIKPIPNQSTEPTLTTRYSDIGTTATTRYSDIGERNTMQYEDTASAAEAAAESAKKAIAAAGAAAYLANRDSYRNSQESVSNGDANGFNRYPEMDTISGKNMSFYNDMKSSSSEVSQNFLPKDVPTQTTYRRHSYNVAPSSYSEDESEYDEEIEVEDPAIDTNRHSNRSPTNKIPKMTHRRHSYNVQPKDTGIKFDESDCEDDFEREEPNRPAPDVPSSRVNSTHRVHPKLPDYDVLAARFDALKYPKV
ncbi:Regulator of Vps4 activity in the MVB pathway protein [Heracleum sosnowskyi]|uniref:Regulator of Vps4 activity in the MVB pathway protein n=1 Tax=Heracleum sosnowskyi TaxID=360622 RepID=A0AAD8IKP2_9APIA|nr:Regulator of Vps4 activity in the MVB pathway protein [Heracleum sosnowskyi]